MAHDIIAALNLVVLGHEEDERFAAAEAQHDLDTAHARRFEMDLEIDAVRENGWWSARWAVLDEANMVGVSSADVPDQSCIIGDFMFFNAQDNFYDCINREEGDVIVTTLEFPMGAVAQVNGGFVYNMDEIPY